VLVFLFAFSANAQVTINEICSRNGSTIADEDGDYPDWIELYNAGASSVNLQGYYLTDDFNTPNMWAFPSISIQPQSYLTLFASGKDRKIASDHWESVVKDNYLWRYLVPTAPVDSTWIEIGFDDTGWLLGTGGMGYGDFDDNTVIASPVSSVYMRYKFTIVDTSVIGNAVFHMDYDDSFVAYLNGVEIARENIGVTGIPSAYDDLAYVDHEALLYQGMLPDEYKFDEALVKTVLVNGTNVLTVQVHNISTTSSDMTARPFLSVGIKDNSSSYDPIPVWFNPGEAFLHTNFNVSGNGESVYLISPSLAVADQLTTPYLQVDHSYGRFPDGSMNNVYFGDPTPDSTNNASANFLGYVTDPIFSLAGGFYPFSQTLVITNSFPSSNTRYTLNGSAPDSNSTLYAGTISIDSNMVIRARSFATGYLPSAVTTNTYFINDISTLPVISITTEPDNLWDWNAGIYVLGPNAEPQNPNFGANFWQNWEIPVHLEFYNVDKTLGFEQDLGMKIHGGWSRAQPQKSLRLLAKGKYGKKTLDYQLFPDKEIFSFKSFILRTSGNETVQNGVFFRDALMHKAVENSFNDFQDYRPTIIYLNGEFWGIQNLRERITEDYLAENHGANPDSVDLLQFDGLVMAGSNVDFIALSDFIITNNMADSANYEVVKGQLDIANFCDHFITQTYYVNWDWPQNNIKYWKSQTPGSKWRYILTDLDMGLGLFGGSFSENDLNRVLTQSNTRHAYMLAGLLQNTKFKNYFINRYADLINTSFHPDKMRKLAYSYRDSIIGEMPRHMDKWGGNMMQWSLINIDANLITFIDNRPAPARDHIEQQFTLKKQVTMALNVYPPGAGEIQVNTIIPDSFPWAGVYFDSVPITLTAIPNPGYEFSFWQSPILVPNPDYNKSITLNVDTVDAFTAYFFGAPDTNRITFNEINYNSDNTMDAGDWVELHNYGTVDVDISGWVFKDSNNANLFNIPDSTMLVQDEYLVLCQDTAKFTSIYPSVSNVIGPFNFGLNNVSETLRLFDDNGDLYISMNYSTAGTWPAIANGFGGTMELLNANNSLSVASNWFDGCYSGSPGVSFTPCIVGEEEIMEEVGMLQLESYPNPFDQSTTLAFALAEEEHVKIRVVNIYGKEVALLADKQFGSGRHYIQFKPLNLSPGIYYCHLVTPSSSGASVISYLGK